MLTSVMSPLPPWSVGAGDSGAALPPITFSGEPKPLLCPIASDAFGYLVPVWSGGSWVSTMPVTNLATPYLHEVARSTNLDLASTQMTCNLTTMQQIALTFLDAHNLTVHARLRVTYATSVANLVDAPVLQTAWYKPWPRGMKRQDTFGLRIAALQLPASPVGCRWGKIEINDSSNPDGYVEFGRGGFCTGYAPQYAMSVGAGLRIESATRKTITAGFSTVVDVAPNQRKWSFKISNQDEARAFENMMVQYQLSLDRQFYMVFDKEDDPRMMPIRSFLATEDSMGGPEWSSSMYLDSGHEASEVLG